MSLAEGHGDVGDVPDAEGNGVEIDTVVVEGQLLGVALHELELHGRRESRVPLLGAVLSDLQHGGVDVQDGDERGGGQRAGTV